MALSQNVPDPVTTVKHNTITWVVVIVVCFLLYQNQTLKPYVTGIGIIVLIGIVLKNYPTISNQFKQIGK